MEVWKRVRLKYPCNQKYYVSNLGRVKSKSAQFGERIITGKANSGNCRVVDYRSRLDKSLQHRFNVAREIYKAFNGKVDKNELVCLKDESQGLLAKNLVVYTRKDYGHLFSGNLVIKTGYHTNNAKIGPDQAKTIRESKKMNTELAAQYGISTMQITRIKRNECWPNL